jgi:hypothetical protein
MPISSVSSGGPNLHRHFRVKTVSETRLIEDFLVVLTDRARLQHLSESHQDFSVIILDHRPPRAGKALFGKMLWVMMAVLEDMRHLPLDLCTHSTSWGVDWVPI